MVFSIDCGICELFGLLKNIIGLLLMICVSVGNCWCIDLGVKCMVIIFCS